MDLNHLRYFYEVALCGSFTKAAQKIHVSQPSVSKMVSSLEQDLKLNLLHRGKKGLKLTDEGQKLFAACQDIFSRLEEVTTTLNDNSPTLVGDLRVGASDNLCNYVLPPILAKIGREYPQLTTKLFSGTASQILSNLQEDKIELGVFYTKTTEGRDFQVTQLKSVEFVLVCSAKNQHMKKSGFGRRGLLDLGFIGSRQEDYSRAYTALEMLHSANIHPRTVFETNNQETQKRMALMDLGYTLVPMHMVQTEIADGDLKQISVGKKFMTSVYLVQKQRRTLSKQASLFVDQLRS